MKWPSSGLYVLLGLLALSACNRTPPQSRPESENVQDAQVAVDAPPPDEMALETAGETASSQTSSPTAGEANEDAASGDEATTAVDSSPNTNDTEATPESSQPDIDHTVETSEPVVPKPTQDEPERVIVLAEVGPIVMDVYIYIDGETYRDRVGTLIDDVLKIGDEDLDGQTTWKELTSSKQFIYGQYGNPQVDSEQQRVELIKAYDINRNNYVDRDEVLGFLRQDAANNQVFYLNENGNEADTVTTSPVFQWLDTNADGLLDETERNSASSRIWKNDTEDDQIIRADDFRTNANNGVVTNRRRSRRAPRKTLVPKEYSDWSKMLYALEEKYAYGNPLTVHDLPEFTAFFEMLDADQDEYLSPREFSEVMNIAPHVRLTISFGADTQQRICVDHLQPSLPLVSVSVSANQLKLAIADSTIQFAVSEPNTSTNVDLQIAAVFERSDTDENGALSEEEFGSLGGLAAIPFAAVDANDDKTVDRDELSAAIANRQLAQESQISGNVGSDQQPLFGQLDINGDGQLTVREVERMPERLKLLDENGDGVIAANERPNSVFITLTRGVAANQFVAARSDAQPVQADESGPPWFRSMDVNDDGEISRREFLGPIESFKKFDADGDQYVSLPEAIAE